MEYADIKHEFRSNLNCKDDKLALGSLRVFIETCNAAEVHDDPWYLVEYIEECLYHAKLPDSIRDAYSAAYELITETMTQEEIERKTA